jgi:hypothetical protein
MKKTMVMMVLLMVVAMGAKAQVNVLGINVYYDSTAKMPYVNVRPVYWTPISVSPVNRVYFRTVSYDMTTAATLEFHVRDASNYNDVYVGTVTMPITTRNLDSAKALAITGIINRVIVDADGDAVLTIKE